MRLTPEAVGQALELLGWSSVKGSYLKKMPWPPQGARSMQEVRVRPGISVVIELKQKVTPTEQHPSRVAWQEIASLSYVDVQITPSCHLKLGPFTL